MNSRTVMLAWTPNQAADMALEYYISTISMPSDIIHLVNISNNNDKELIMKSKAEKVKNECQNVKVNVHSIKSNDIENDLIKCSNILNVDLVIIGRRKLGHWERLTTDEGKSLSSHLANVITKPLIVVKFFKD